MLGVACLTLGAFATRHPNPRAVCALGVALAGGAFGLADRLDAAERGRPAVPLEATLEGRVLDVRRSAGGFAVDLDRVTRAGAGQALPQRLRLSGQPTPDGVAAIEAALPGEWLRLRARLRRPSELANPGGREHLRDLARAGVGASGRLVHPALHVRIPERERARPFAALYGARARLDHRLAQTGPGGGLLRALALGERAGLSLAVQDAFARLGLAHLLSVSGLHLALVAGLVFAAARALLGRWVWLAARRDSRTPALLIAVVAASFYALLSGWDVPVRRSLLLVLAVALAMARGRRGGALEALAAASLVILAEEPQALFSAGFQLSFAASAALALAPRGDALTSGSVTGRVWSWLREGFSSSATALAATSPLAAVQLGNVAPIALLANLVAIPWTGAVVLPVSLLATALAALPESLQPGWLLALMERIAAGTLAAVAAAAAWLPTFAARPPPALGWLAAAALVAFGALCVRATKLRVLLCLAANGLLALAPPARLPVPLPRLVVLDVGQGDALLVQGRRGAVLVDAGPARPDGFDLGSRVVVPALAALGVARLDLFVVTHADLDHRGGAPAVLARVAVDRLWLPYGAREDPDFADVLAAAEARGVPVEEQGARSPPLRAGDLRIEPLWPPADARGGSRNDRSLAVRISVAGRRVLLPGDLEARAEAMLIASGVDLHADVLALGHHGSRTSSTPGLLAAVAPSLALVSAPCHGRFGMPHPEVRARAAAAGAPVWWTGRDGALVVGLGEPLHVWGWTTGTGIGPRCRRARRWSPARCDGMLRACPRSVRARSVRPPASRACCSRSTAVHPRAT